jgi:hypothetical protein
MMSVRAALLPKLLLAACLAPLAACGGPVSKGRANFIAECKSSDDPKTCICIADHLKANADPDVYAALMAASAKDNARGEEMVEALPLSKKLSIPGAMIEAALACEGK